MADTPETDKLAVREPEDAPARDPITSRTTSSILVVCALLMTGVLAWALYDEVYGQRPWKQMQREFVRRENRYLKRLKRTGNPTEKEVKESAEYQRLDAEAKQARAEVKPDVEAIDRRVSLIDKKLSAIAEPFQDKRGRLTLINYRVENASGSDKDELRRDAERLKTEPVEVEMPVENGVRTERLNYTQIEELFNSLKDEKAALLTQRGEKLLKSGELEKKRDEYLKDNLIGLTDQQLDSLIKRNENFDFSLRQINVASADIVDRCETCHLGIREPIELTPANMRRPRRRPDSYARAFTSHPSKELLQIHSPERFGCSSCHGGNGRATTSVTKGHGRHRFWLHPLYQRENMEAGCQQCHSNDRVLQGAPTLTKGKDLFQERGCVGCHRYEGFDRETDGIATTRQTIKQIEDEIIANEREAKKATFDADNAQSDDESVRLRSRAESLRVTNSQLEARLDQLNIQSRYLMQDQKKVGPNLKDVRLKLRKEWIPEWLRDPQAFRPGTKMPTYWYLSGGERQDNERKAIAAYLWQSAFEGQLPAQPQGDPVRGKELFDTRGCMACHSVGEGDQRVGGDFAANLQRLGEKANYEYIVRWIHNPRERTAPYCPKEKRDLTAADYEQAGLPFVFDSSHSKCPNDGAELQVQNMTVMPNFRLTESDTRDIATYLITLSSQANYPDASYMDDPRLKETGRLLIKQYGCAGCHEIRGFEEEQRIGKELTTEGATPIERLDFARLTHAAEQGHDPLDPNKHIEPWYNHKGFFEYKLKEPGIYDLGKEKDPRDHLRMPRPFLTDDWRNALTTFLLGSVGAEGANVPSSLFYNATNAQKDIQDGWWVIKKYNCMGCHSIQVGQQSDLSMLPQYQTPEGREQLPPALMTEGARVDPAWLLRFLEDPSLSAQTEDDRSGAVANTTDGTRANQSGTPSGAFGVRSQTPPGPEGGTQTAPRNGGGGGGQVHALPPQPGEDRNGVRTYLRARMPTFNFSPNERRTLVRFFLAVSSQQEPYIRERLDPLTDEERQVARAIFTSTAAPCLKCHLTGNAEHDQTASAPNFIQAGDRLKPDWTFRWLLDPQRIIPGTTMPSELFKREGERWVFNANVPGIENYQGDHARLLMRYILQLTPQEQATISRGSTARAPVAPSGTPPGVASAHGRSRSRPASSAATRAAPQRRATPATGSQRASRGAGTRTRRQQISRSARARPGARRARGAGSGVTAVLARGLGGFRP